LRKNSFFDILKSLFILIKNIMAFVIYHIFEVLIGPLVVIGAILCIMVFEPWPLKFLYMAIWLFFLFFMSKFIDKINRKK